MEEVGEQMLRALKSKFNLSTSKTYYLLLFALWTLKLKKNIETIRKYQHLISTFV